MSRSALALAATLLLTTMPVAAAPKVRPTQTCAAEIGRSGAAALARDCRDAAPPSPAICRPETPCQALRDAIETACRNAGAEARPVCAEHLDPEDDDDDEEE